jgi:hypothetical protein
MNRNNILSGLFHRALSAAAPRRKPLGRAARCAIEPLEDRTLMAAVTETFTGGKGPFTSSFNYSNNALVPRGFSDASETLQLTSGAPFQVINFKLTHNGSSGSVTRVRIIGFSAANSNIYDNEFNTPLNTPVTINVNTKVSRLEFQPITVLQSGIEFVGQGVLRTALDDFQYDPDVPANTPPQLTGLGAGKLGSFPENGQLSIFSSPQLGINAAIQDPDGDILTVDVQADDPNRGLLIGQDVDGECRRRHRHRPRLHDDVHRPNRRRPQPGRDRLGPGHPARGQRGTHDHVEREPLLRAGKPARLRP